VVFKQTGMIFVLSILLLEAWLVEWHSCLPHYRE